MKKDLALSGKVVSGIKQGAFFASLEWFQKQCLEKLGFKPYPGTLNLELSLENIPIINELEQKKGVEFIPPNATFCTGRAFPVLLEGIRGAIIIPAEEVRVHGKNTVEVIAPLRLKEALDLKHGDFVRLTFESVLLEGMKYSNDS